MEVPRLGVRSELQLPAYTTVRAMLDLSCLPCFSSNMACVFLFQGRACLSPWPRMLFPHLSSWIIPASPSSVYSFITFSSKASLTTLFSILLPTHSPKVSNTSFNFSLTCLLIHLYVSSLLTALSSCLKFLLSQEKRLQ
uniref:Uncharacterized protein n=1 Tax=Sus scrofa TaxID=9823 RepID=A0A8W4FCX2_PIG